MYYSLEDQVFLNRISRNTKALSFFNGLPQIKGWLNGLVSSSDILGYEVLKDGGDVEVEITLKDGQVITVKFMLQRPNIMKLNEGLPV